MRISSSDALRSYAASHKPDTHRPTNPGHGGAGLTGKSAAARRGMQQEAHEHGVGEKKRAEDVGQPVGLEAEHVPGRSEVLHGVLVVALAHSSNATPNVIADHRIAARELIGGQAMP